MRTENFLVFEATLPFAFEAVGEGFVDEGEKVLALDGEGGAVQELVEIGRIDCFVRNGLGNEGSLVEQDFLNTVLRECLPGDLVAEVDEGLDGGNGNWVVVDGEEVIGEELVVFFWEICLDSLGEAFLSLAEALEVGDA